MIRLGSSHVRIRGVTRREKQEPGTRWGLRSCTRVPVRVPGYPGTRVPVSIPSTAVVERGVQTGSGLTFFLNQPCKALVSHVLRASVPRVKQPASQRTGRHKLLFLHELLLCIVRMYFFCTPRSAQRYGSWSKYMHFVKYRKSNGTRERRQ